MAVGFVKIKIIAASARQIEILQSGGCQRNGKERNRTMETDLGKLVEYEIIEYSGNFAPVCP